MIVIKELNPRRINSPEGCTILIINVCTSRGGVTFIGHIWLIGISDALIGRKFCCILYIIMLYFSSVDTDEFRKRIKERLIKQRSKEFNPSLSLLIPQEGEKIWGEKRKANKVEMLGQLIGYRHKMNTGKDDIYMRKYLTKVSKTGLNKPDYLRTKEFLPIDAPLVDFLIEDTAGLDGWKYPKLEELKYFQENRGLNLGMLAEIEVRELVCGVSSDQEVDEVHDWVTTMYRRDQATFGTNIISMDVEDVKTTYYDTLRMAGKVRIHDENAVLRTRVETEMLYEYGKDGWKQIPGKIMFGNGITWVCIISLNLSRNRRDEYILERMNVQPGILDLLRDLPVSAGLGVRRDIRGVQEFYSLISGVEVNMGGGFIDLTSLAIVAGYKFHSKNMTAMGVQIMGTLLNKNVSTGDNMWGLRWSEIPAALRCYALGDIKFGFVTYNVLAGLLLRDVFPDPDMLCRYLVSDQLTAVNWFLEWLVISLEGVEFHQIAEESARTRGEMISSLRFRDARDKLCDISPTYIQLWSQLLGNWPSPTSGGCRYLIQCREWFLVQMRVLSRANVQWKDGRVLQEPTASDLEYARFGISPELIGNPSWMEPVSGTRGLVRYPGISAEKLVFDPSTTKSSDIGAKCTALGRSQRWCLLEWARLNPEKLRFFFVRLIRDVGFRMFYRNLFDAMRLCYLRIFDELAPKVSRVDMMLNQSVKRTLDEETAALVRSETETKTRRERVAWLTGLSTDWSLRERTRWREGIPNLPEWKRRNGRKRKWSKAKSKPGKNVRKRIKLAQGSRTEEKGEPVTRALDAPGESSPNLRSAPIRPSTGGLDIEIQDQDGGKEVLVDPVSVEVATGDRRVRMTPVRRTQRGARAAISDAVRFKTYDEMIEEKDDIAFPDDLEFNFEIPKEVEEIEV